MRSLTILLPLAALAGCNQTQGTVTLDADGRVRSLYFNSWNLASNRSLNLADGDRSLAYGNSPDQALAAQLAGKIPSIEQLLQLRAGLAGTPPRREEPAPAPALPAPLAPPDPDDVDR